MKECILEIQNQLHKEGLDIIDENYVIMVFEVKNKHEKLRFLYRSFTEFNEKVEIDCEQINSDLGIEFVWKTFD